MTKPWFKSSQPLFSRPIEDCELSARVLRMLRDQGVKDTGQVAELGEGFWARTPGCGKEALDELRWITGNWGVASSPVLLNGKKGEVMSAWRPIETAPKDDKPVDLWVKWWVPRTDTFTGKRVPNCAWTGGVGWASPVGMPQGVHITHWMPIPEPPTDEGKS